MLIVRQSLYFNREERLQRRCIGAEVQTKPQFFVGRRGFVHTDLGQL